MTQYDLQYARYYFGLSNRYDLKFSFSSVDHNRPLYKYHSVDLLISKMWYKTNIQVHNIIFIKHRNHNESDSRESLDFKIKTFRQQGRILV